MSKNSMTMFGVKYDNLIGEIKRFQSNFNENTIFFQGGDDLNLLSDYKSDVKFFNFRGYMGINPYQFARGSSFHY